MRSRSRKLAAISIGGVVALIALTACRGPSEQRAIVLNGGSKTRGKAAAQRYGCNACHAISGLPDPSVQAAAPVTGIADRAYIAGTLANTPDNLVTWIRFPRRVKPRTAMPDLDVSLGDARDIAAYLYSLH